MLSPSRCRQPVWLFDLDNTLHDASHAIFPAINHNMNAFIEGVLKAQGQEVVCADSVNALRIAYLQRYGATLLGMMRHHAVEPSAFLEAAHDFDDLRAMLRTERGLGRLLQRLPGRKILLTNAPQRYAQDILRHLNLHRHFSHQIAIESMHVHRQLRPKPSHLLLRKLLATHGLAPERCILVEDTLANLKTAKSLGLRTAWVTGYLRGPQQLHPAAAPEEWVVPMATEPCPAYVDVKVKFVRQLSRHLHRLGASYPT